MLQHYFGILVIVTFAKLHEALKQCHASTYSVYGHNLSRHGDFNKYCVQAFWLCDDVLRW